MLLLLKLPLLSILTSFDHYRARPVVKLNAEITITPQEVDLETQSCNFNPKVKAACFSVETCFSYTGKNLPSTIGGFPAVSMSVASTSLHQSFVQIALILYINQLRCPTLNQGRAIIYHNGP